MANEVLPNNLELLTGHHFTSLVAPLANRIVVGLRTHLLSLNLLIVSELIDCLNVNF